MGTGVSAIVIARSADRLVDGGGILSKSDINIKDVDLKTNIHADLPKVLDENPNVLTDSTASKNHMDMSANLEAPNVDIGQNHGGVSLKERIQANIADSQQARESSNFKSHVDSENVHRIGDGEGIFNEEDVQIFNTTKPLYGQVNDASCVAGSCRMVLAPNMRFQRHTLGRL